LIQGETAFFIFREEENIMPEKESDVKPDDLKFEEAMQRLEDLVDKMESGELPLDEMLKAYEEGAKLAAVCKGQLAAFEKKIEVLTKETAEGGQWRDFNPATADRREVGSDSSDAPF
jgi:exodeoxyribonuclease VII small subunit